MRHNENQFRFLGLCTQTWQQPQTVFSILEVKKMPQFLTLPGIQIAFTFTSPLPACYWIYQRAKVQQRNKKCQQMKQSHRCLRLWLPLAWTQTACVFGHQTSHRCPLPRHQVWREVRRSRSQTVGSIQLLIYPAAWPWAYVLKGGTSGGSDP